MRLPRIQRRQIGIVPLAGLGAGVVVPFDGADRTQELRPFQLTQGEFDQGRLFDPRLDASCLMWSRSATGTRIVVSSTVLIHQTYISAYNLSAG